MHTIAPAQEASPYRLLWLAVLVAVVLAQLAGLVMLARSQVQKAEMRAITERSARWEAANCFESGERNAACSVRLPSAGEEGLITAGYAPSH